jgi:hypothetical protein
MSFPSNRRPADIESGAIDETATLHLCRDGRLRSAGPGAALSELEFHCAAMDDYEAPGQERR